VLDARIAISGIIVGKTGDKHQGHRGGGVDISANSDADNEGRREVSGWWRCLNGGYLLGRHVSDIIQDENGMGFRVMVTNIFAQKKSAPHRVRAPLGRDIGVSSCRRQSSKLSVNDSIKQTLAICIAVSKRGVRQQYVGWRNACKLMCGAAHESGAIKFNII
jgi:hypothetical protein